MRRMDSANFAIPNGISISGLPKIAARSSGIVTRSRARDPIPF
jgi:hypothetical protein